MQELRKAKRRITMKRNILVAAITMIVIAMVGGALCAPLTAHATGMDARKPTKDVYALRERCEKASAQRFHEEIGKEGPYSDNGRSGTRGYTSHYNVKLNTCFMLIEDTGFSKKKGQDKSKVLWDLNEDKKYGDYEALGENKKPLTVWYCRVLEKSCQSEQEWDLLVKPCMEE